MRRNRGFTLIELLIVTVLTGLIAIYMLESVITTNRTYAVVDQVAESQMGMRAVADLLERNLRHAGMMVPRAAAVCAVDNTAGPDVLYLSDAEAIDPGDDLLPYDGARAPSTKLNVTTPNDTITVSSLVLEPAAPNRPAYDSDGDGTNDSDFEVGSGAIVIDLNDPSRGAACGRVTALNPATPSVSIAFATADLGAGGGSEQLVVIPAHEYRIANGDELRRNGRLLTQGVEDMQVSFFFDANDNAVVDYAAGEIQGDGGPGGNYVAKDTDISELRQVRANLVMRTRMEDREFTGQPQVMENRAGGAPADGFRRRVYTTTVRLRNMVDRAGS